MTTFSIYLIILVIPAYIILFADSETQIRINNTRCIIKTIALIKVLESYWRKFYYKYPPEPLQWVTLLREKIN